MAEYEVLREIFNQCSGNQMRDIFVEETEIEDINQFMNRYRVGKVVEEERFDNPDGTVIVDVITDGLHQRISFTLL